MCAFASCSTRHVCPSADLVQKASPADGSAIEKHAEDEPGFRTNVYGCTTTTHPMERRANALTSSSHALLGSMFQGSNGSCCGKAVLQHARRSRRKVIAVFHRLNFRSTDNLSAVEPSHPESMYVGKCRGLSLRSALSEKVVNTDVDNDVTSNPCRQSPRSPRLTGATCC